MVKTHKIALKPNKTQAKLLSQHCGYARVAYNHALNLFKAGLDNDTWLSLYDLKRAFNAVKNAEYEWCSALSQNASKNAFHHLDKAIKNWRNKTLPARFPKHAKRSKGQSYQADNGKGTVKVAGHAVSLPKIGWIKMVEALRFEGEILTATVAKSYGRWFVCLTVETGEAPPDKRDGETIGIDMGIKTLATYSDGTTIENPKGRIDRQYRKLRRVDKAIARSRNTHGKTNRSHRRQRLYHKRQRIYGRIEHIRNDVHHKATSALAKATTVGKVIVETLHVAGMRRNKHLSRAFHRAGIAGFLRMLEYKCEWHGVAFEKADRWFASTKTCSGCGQKKVAMDLSERDYVCMACGLVLDRDWNAARNLANDDAASPAESQNGRRGTIRPVRTKARPAKRLFESEQLALNFG